MPTRDANGNLDHHPPLFSAGNTLPFVLVTALFLFWGIPSNMNDILIKQFMKSFEITRLKAGLIQSAFYMGYFVLAVPAALVMRRYGYKTGLVIGLFLYSAGTFLFWPAAIVRQYGFFFSPCSSSPAAPPFWRREPTRLSPCWAIPELPSGGSTSRKPLIPWEP